jgi:hypothetical protein
MQHTIVLTALAGLVLGATALAVPTPTDPCDGECPIAKAVDPLLASWEASNAKAAALPAAEKEALGAQLASVAAECPVGSRIGATVSAVRDVLAFVGSSQEGCADECAIRNGTVDSAEARAMLAGRTAAIGKLHQLASFTADATACTVSCGETDAGCDDASAACPIRIAARIGELNASFAVARTEVESLDAAARARIASARADLAVSGDAVRLVPQSIAALTAGLETLHELHGHMSAWAQAHPEVLKDLPASARQAFRMEVALLEEARSLMASVTETIAVMQGEKSAMATPGR